MNKILLTIVGLMSVAGMAHASNVFSYTGTGSPGSTPDGVDQNNSPVDVWTVVTTPGGTDGMGDNGADGSGVGFYNPDGSSDVGGNANAWQEYSYQNDGVGLGGSVNAFNTFAGGALAIGQTVSLNFVMRATDPSTDGRPAGEVGVSLLSGSSDAVTFYVYGGGPGNYFYTDAVTHCPPNRGKASPACGAAAFAFGKLHCHCEQCLWKRYQPRIAQCS